MAGEWRQVTFADVIDIISGGTPKTRISEYWGGSIPWLSVSDFNTGYRWVNTAGKSITERGLAESATTILNQGDIIISARGTVGVVAQLAKPMAFNQSCYGIRGKQGLSDTNFIYYALSHAVSQMEQVAHGGVFNTITRDTFKIIKTNLPPIKEQQAIACILGALDDKIELNRQMNRTLEAIAQAIFKSWFIDFDPVIDNAILSGKPIPDKFAVRAEVRREILARSNKGVAGYRHLFPDEFQDSPLGMIPKGWEASTVGDEFDVTMGQSPPGSTYNEEGDGLPFFQGRRNFGFRYPIRRIFCTAPKRIAKTGDTLVSVRAPVGDVNMAPEQLCVGRGLAGVRHTTDSRSYTYYSMLSLRKRFREYESNGTVFGAINKSQFAGLEYIGAPSDVVAAFESQLFAVDERVRLNESESIRLALVRDSLLPQLLAGELWNETQEGT